MDDQNRNLILASVLSFLVIVAWFFFFPPPEPVQTSAVESTVKVAALTNKICCPIKAIPKIKTIVKANKSLFSKLINEIIEKQRILDSEIKKFKYDFEVQKQIIY